MRRESNMLAIDIIDNGPGLPKHNRARLLEPYVTTQGSQGTGLGLAIVQKITEAARRRASSTTPSGSRTDNRRARDDKPAAHRFCSRLGRRMPHPRSDRTADASSTAH